MLKNSVRSITSLLDVNSVYKKFNNKIENVNGFSFAFFYISKLFAQFMKNVATRSLNLA